MRSGYRGANMALLETHAKGKNVADAVFTGTCPNCLGPISSHRLEMGLPCTTCLTDDARASELAEISDTYRKILAIRSSLTVTQSGVFTLLYDTLSSFSDFERFFTKSMGRGFWDLQKTWSLRLIMGESFAITAPTGVGKTTLLLHFALYNAANMGKKVYILVPTETLLLQTINKLSHYMKNTGVTARLLYYNSRESRKKREDALERLKKREYDILVTTTGFLSRRFDLVKGHKFDLIIVDDADSLLKNSKNIDRILFLLGFNENDIENAYKLIKAKRNYIFYKLSGKNEKAQETLLEIEELKASIEESKAMNRKGQLAIASATGRQAGIKPKLFRELLDFEIGGLHDYMRNIIEAYLLVKSWELNHIVEQIRKIYEKLGPGGLVFVSRDMGKAYAKALSQSLNDIGIKAAVAISGKKAIKMLADGKVGLVVGVASYYGTIVRGVDLPQKIKYAIFVGVPKNRIRLEKALQSPRRLAMVITYLIDEGLFGEDYSKELYSLVKKIEKLHYGEIMALRIAFANSTTSKLEGKLADIAMRMKHAIDLVSSVLEKMLTDKGQKISLGTGYVERGEDGELYFVSPDTMTYLQASGRTSRFLDDRMTLGLSIIMETDILPVEALKKRIKRYVTSFNPLPLDELDLDDIAGKLYSSRTGGEGSKSFKPARSVMIVVESPHKAKTIANYFGKPSRRRLPGVIVYETPIIDPDTLDTYLALIVASKGHIYDLVIDDNVGLHGVVVKPNLIVPVFSQIKHCMACGYTFSSTSSQCPRCGERVRIKSSNDVIQSLRKLALEVQEVLIATDPDVEGEKIAWDIYLTIKPFNHNIRRIEFNEVTKQALIAALRRPRGILYNRVKAQLARRISDRWIGFTLSQHLWSVFDKRWLGAGRVQTPVLGWVIKRYDEWEENKGYWVILFLKGLPPLKLFYRERRDAEKTINLVSKQRHLTILQAEKKIVESKPLPPFTTDDVLRTANKLLGFSTSLTMKLLQNLFEAGLITYHRTDSTRVSSKGTAIASVYIKDKLQREDILSPRTWGEGGAHEAIRPVHPIDAKELYKHIVDGTIRTPIQLTDLHLKLYDIIFRRFMASQSRPAVIEKCQATINVGSKKTTIEVVTRVLEEGYLVFWPVNISRIVCGEGEKIEVENVKMVKGSSIPLYTQGDVISIMKEKGLGRPSTYVKILENVRRHGYIVVSKKRKYLIPTKLGRSVHNYLATHYQELVSEERTSMLEKQMDLIEEGQMDYTRVLFDLLNELKGYGLVDITTMNRVEEGTAIS